jgi:hypothetical protein
MCLIFRMIFIYSFFFICFFRYAVVLCDNEEQATNVIEHATQYQINGQSLVISFYRNEKPLHASTRDLAAK